MAFEGLQQGILGFGQGIASGITQNWMREQQLKQQEWENKLAKEQLKLRQDYFQFQQDQEDYQRQKDAEAAQRQAIQDKLNADATRFKLMQAGLGMGIPQQPQFKTEQYQSIFPSTYNVPQERKYAAPLSTQRMAFDPNAKKMPLLPDPVPDESIKGILSYYSQQAAVEGKPLTADYFKDAVPKNKRGQKYMNTLNFLEEVEKTQKINDKRIAQNRKISQLGGKAEMKAPVGGKGVHRYEVEVPNIIMPEGDEPEWEITGEQVGRLALQYGIDPNTVISFASGFENYKDTESALRDIWKTNKAYVKKNTSGNKTVDELYLDALNKVSTITKRTHPEETIVESAIESALVTQRNELMNQRDILGHIHSTLQGDYPASVKSRLATMFMNNVRFPIDEITTALDEGDAEEFVRLIEDSGYTLHGYGPQGRPGDDVMTQRFIDEMVDTWRIVRGYIK